MLAKEEEIKMNSNGFANIGEDVIEHCNQIHVRHMNRISHLQSEQLRKNNQSKYENNHNN